MIEFAHVSVLLEEAVSSLLPEKGGIFVDCTAGGGGHSEEILKRLPAGSRLISIDQDERAVERCRERLSVFGTASTVVKSNFSDIDRVLDGLGVDEINGALWDLGVSSVQLDEPERGFSYTADAPLDMRMDRSSRMTAADIVNGYSEEELRRILRDYGEEKFHSRIASAIVSARTEKPIETTFELADIVTKAIPTAARFRENQHPCRRTFMALRIELNNEISIIEPAIESVVKRLKTGGRASVITFHSLEDRVVKQTFKKLEHPCTCPPDFPVCVCGKKPSVKLVTKKPMIPTDAEIAANPRARSAKLRVAEKI